MAGPKQAQSRSSPEIRVIITVCRCIVLQRELIMPGHVITLVLTGDLLHLFHFHLANIIIKDPRMSNMEPLRHRPSSGPVNSGRIQFSHLILNYSMFSVPERI